jgi:hypothetical protein
LEGGADGGDWIECRPIGDSLANRFFCTIYEDHAGEIVYKGVFRLEGSSATMAQLLDLVGPYTGDEIHLSDGRMLIAEVPIDSSTYEEIMARKYEDYVHDRQSRNDHKSEEPR